jgi:hypothetical protein
MAADFAGLERRVAIARHFRRQPRRSGRCGDRCRGGMTSEAAGIRPRNPSLGPTSPAGTRRSGGRDRTRPSARRRRRRSPAWSSGRMSSEGTSPRRSRTGTEYWDGPHNPGCLLAGPPANAEPAKCPPAVKDCFGSRAGTRCRSAGGHHDRSKRLTSSTKPTRPSPARMTSTAPFTTPSLRSTRSATAIRRAVHKSLPRFGHSSSGRPVQANRASPFTDAGAFDAASSPSSSSTTRRWTVVSVENWPITGLALSMLPPKCSVCLPGSRSSIISQ